MALSYRTILVLALALTCALGLVRIFIARLKFPDRLAFARQYIDKLKTYTASDGRDNEAYGWLMHRSNRMQKEMGYHGIYAKYRPPYANFQYSNYPIVLNMLPELRKTMEDPLFSRSVLGHQYSVSIQEAIIRYAGELDDQADECDKNLKNPFIWFREGVRVLLSIPVALLGWLGAISENTVSRLISSKGFNFVSGFLGFVGFVSAIMGIALGWEQFHTMMLSWLKDF